MNKCAVAIFCSVSFSGSSLFIQQLPGQALKGRWTGVWKESHSAGLVQVRPNQAATGSGEGWEISDMYRPSASVPIHFIILSLSVSTGFRTEQTCHKSGRLAILRLISSSITY